MGIKLENEGTKVLVNKKEPKIGPLPNYLEKVSQAPKDVDHKWEDGTRKYPYLLRSRLWHTLLHGKVFQFLVDKEMEVKETWYINFTVGTCVPELYQYLDVKDASTGIALKTCWQNQWWI